MGFFADSSGDLFADGLGTVVNVADAVVIGQAGSALAQVTNVCVVLADDTVIGQNATGDGRLVVSGHTSLWQQDNAMTVGDAGRGDLQVLTQRRIDTTNVVLGNGESRAWDWRESTAPGRCGTWRAS